MAEAASILETISEPVTLTLLVTTVALVSFMVLKDKEKRQMWPAGPPTIPILGNVPQLLMSKDLSMIEFMEDCRKRYGNIFTVEFGGTKRVVVSGFDNMQEILVKKADYSSTRTTHAMPQNYTEIAKKTPGLFWAKHPHWKTIRSFALNILREEGMGKSSLEPGILHEIHCYIDHFIKPNLGKPFRVSDSLMLATANVMGSMILSNRRDYEEPAFLAWMHAFGDSVQAAVKAAVARNIPGAAYMPGDLTGVRSDKRAADMVIPEIMESVKKHRAKIDKNHPVDNDFIDRFIIHGMKEAAKGNNTEIFTDGNAGITTLQLYAAGTETTSTALRWALLFMCLYPEVQDKVHKEVDKTIGTRDVTFKDRMILPYTEAVLLEVLRRGNIAPNALPHTMEKELAIDGQVIPAGAELMLNMTSVLWDEEVFENPREFNPDRYLEGDIALKKARSIPFGIGRRSCLGEGLAKMELMLFFTTFMQKFKVSSPPDQKLSLIGTSSIVHAPQQFDVIFEER